jgi:hypothetical protein
MQVGWSWSGAGIHTRRFQCIVRVNKRRLLGRLMLCTSAVSELFVFDVLELDGVRDGVYTNVLRSSGVVRNEGGVNVRAGTVCATATHYAPFSVDDYILAVCPVDGHATSEHVEREYHIRMVLCINATWPYSKVPLLPVHAY